MLFSYLCIDYFYFIHLYLWNHFSPGHEFSTHSYLDPSFIFLEKRSTLNFILSWLFSTYQAFSNLYFLRMLVIYVLTSTYINELCYWTFKCLVTNIANTYMTMNFPFFHYGEILFIKNLQIGNNFVTTIVLVEDYLFHVRKNIKQ